MGTNLNQKKAAQEFASKWAGKGKEKSQGRTFWLELLQKVYNVEDVFDYISFEDPVELDNISFIDAYIQTTHVLIEQKSSHVDLNKPIKQSDNAVLTPYLQAKRYDDNVGYSKKARWIVICNFREFHIFDMEKPKSAPEIIKLEDLPKEYHRLQFLVSTSATHIKKEEQVSLKAGEIVGVLYDRILREYKNPDNPESQKSLNKLCVRLVFCLYAEDAGIFGTKNMFHDYMDKFPASEFRSKLIELFRVLDTRYEDRDDYMDESLAAFPYVNGGLFSGDIEIPRINDEIRTLILQRASDDFDWSDISPTIFGAVFESTLNPETRRKGGMHYTSVENIHKVIDPLFLDDLKAELATIKSAKRDKRKKAIAFQEKLSALKFFDPACGSGNFLTESYTSLRRLENEAIRIIYSEGVAFMEKLYNPIKVSINQFYGIEINDFACSVAQTALWIAESQMMQETIDIVGYDLDYLPLKTYTNIHEGNALRIDWTEIIPAAELNYIMGNPPFIGSSLLSDEQKIDRENIFAGKGGELDYVACWYKKSADYIDGYPIRCAFVSTNSICQGQQVVPLWRPLTESGIKIDFVYRTFKWDNEANVYCIIVGFSRINPRIKTIFDQNVRQETSNINGYLLPLSDIYIDKRSHPICQVPQVVYGIKPADNGYLLLNDEEKENLLKKRPESKKWIRPFITAKAFIHGKNRWCLWLKGITPAELNQLPEIRERVVKLREWRTTQKITGDAYKLRDAIGLMRPSSKFREGRFIILPLHTGEDRMYIPFGFSKENDIPGNSVSIVSQATDYHFGVLCSLVHMAWTRVVCGRLEMRYRYNSDIVYNNFPWPTVTPKQKEKIEQTAQSILDARALYPDSSFADLYDDTVMPIELRKAHHANDTAVMEAYGFAKNLTETEIVTRLFQLYKKFVKDE